MVRIVSYSEIAAMMDTGNIKDLSSIFHRADNWDTRETIAVALRDIVWKKLDFNRTEIIDAFKSIEERCKAEIGGGTYRTNCLDIAQNMIAKLQADKSDRK